MPEHVFADPAEVDALAARYPIVLHAVGLSIGTAFAGGAPDAAAAAHVDRVREVARRARPAYVSDHVAIVRSPGGLDVGHLLPVPYTEESLALVAARARRLQDAFGVPLLLENIARPFRFGAHEMDEPEFFGRLVESSGCGLLLDATNLLYNARNLGLDAEAEIDRYPLGAIRAVHLAGGFRAEDGFWVDSHSRPLDRDGVGLLRRLAGRAPVDVVIVERDTHLPPLAELCAEAAAAAAAWPPDGPDGPGLGGGPSGLVAG
jgi:hypothetical protein